MMDTLQAYKKLREAGMSEGQADALTKVLDEHLTRKAATKDDLRIAVADLKTSIAEVKSHIWVVVVAAGLLQTGLITGLILKMIHTP